MFIVLYLSITVLISAALLKVVMVDVFPHADQYIAANSRCVVPSFTTAAIAPVVCASSSCVSEYIVPSLLGVVTDWQMLQVMSLL